MLSQRKGCGKGSKDVHHDNEALCEMDKVWRDGYDHLICLFELGRLPLSC